MACRRGRGAHNTPNPSKIYCDAQGKGRGKGSLRKVTQRLFIDYRWWMVDILSLMLYTKFGCHHHIAASSTEHLKIRLLNS